MKLKANEERKKALKESKTKAPEQEEATLETVLSADVEETKGEPVAESKIVYDRIALTIVENPKNGWYQVVSIRFNLTDKKAEFGEVLYESPMKGEAEMRFKMEAAYSFNMGD